MLYLLVALGIGLSISSAVKSQFVASQITMLVTFLPAVMLSGFSLRSAQHAGAGAADDLHRCRRATTSRCCRRFFSAGDIWAVILPNMAVLAGMAAALAAVDVPGDPEDVWLEDKHMLEAIFRILALTRKELLAILKDPRSRYSLLIPPILAVSDLRLCGDLRFERCSLCGIRSRSQRGFAKIAGGVGRLGRVSPRCQPRVAPRTCAELSMSGALYW